MLHALGSPDGSLHRHCRRRALAEQAVARSDPARGGVPTRRMARPCRAARRLRGRCADVRVHDLSGRRGTDQTGSLTHAAQRRAAPGWISAPATAVRHGLFRGDCLARGAPPDPARGPVARCPSPSCGRTCTEPSFSPPFCSDWPGSRTDRREVMSRPPRWSLDADRTSARVRSRGDHPVSCAGSSPPARSSSTHTYGDRGSSSSSPGTRPSWTRAWRWCPPPSGGSTMRCPAGRRAGRRSCTPGT